MSVVPDRVCVHKENVSAEFGQFQKHPAMMVTHFLVIFDTFIKFMVVFTASEERT